MDSSGILELIDQLDDDVDDLEESLAPLLKTALSDTASKLPLLDKAKLYILVTYAIESILFAYLRTNGVKAREHPIFKELTRVKQYFDKIKVAEEPPAERTTVLDKGAAARFIKAGLSGNDKFDLERAEKQAKERARAHIRFQQLEQADKKRKAEGQDTVEAEASSTDSSNSSFEDETKSVPKQKKQKVRETSHSDSASGSKAETTTAKVKRNKVEKSTESSVPGQETSSVHAQKKKSRGKKNKKKSGTNTPL